MKDVKKKLQRLQIKLRYNREDSLCNEKNNVNIMVHKKIVNNRKKKYLMKYGQKPAVAFRLSHSGRNKSQKVLTKHISMTEINKKIKLSKIRTRSNEAVNINSHYNTKFVVNRVSEYHFNDYLSPFNFPTQKKWKVYRCQLSKPEDSCCCSCNSDAMFEVMKSLYDCYKKKNCDNCNCILCSHLSREERRLGEERKSLASLDTKRKRKRAEKMLEGKTPAEKEEILKDLIKTGQPLPKGRTVSEKSLIKKMKTDLGVPESKTTSKAVMSPSERMKKAKIAGLITPLEGKTPEQKERIVKGLAMQGLPLPEGRTISEKKIIEKVRKELALPPEPKTSSMKEKYIKAADAGLMQPLEGKSPKEKKRILQGLHDRGIPLPEGRTASEKDFIAKVKAGVRTPSVRPSVRLRKAKAAGLLTPIEGKPPEQQEKILRGLAMQGLPLPSGKTFSEKKLIEKVRADVGLPPKPKTTSMKEKYAEAADAGILQPLEGKSPKEKERILQGLKERGIPLPEGRTASEADLIAKVKAGIRAPSDKLRRARAAGLLTPLERKTPSQKERILKGLAMEGLPLPEAKTGSDKHILEKVHAELGLPPAPKTSSMRQKYAEAADAGILQPLEGKSPKEKERILQGLKDRGIPLPKGRTASEDALIERIRTGVRAPSDRLRRAKAAGLITPLKGKTPSKKEQILRGLAMEGLALPEAESPSDKKLAEKIRADLGLPPEPKTASMRQKYADAADTGLLQPLEKKSPKEKERILQGLHDKGIPLPKGRTVSEEALIERIKAGVRAPSERLRQAKVAGLLTPLDGKTPSQKERIMKGLAMEGLPLPEAKTGSDKQILEKVHAELGLPPAPKTASMRQKYAEAADAGILQPLEGKSPKEKERILQGLKERGIPLPKGRTASEDALIERIKTGVRAPSDRLRQAKAAGLITPLEGKTPSQKERIMKGLAMQGLPLPEAKTTSEKKLTKKVRDDLGLPLEPKTSSMRQKYAKALDAGLLQPLEGKSPKEKERILQGLKERGIPLPKGRTASEDALIERIKTGVRAPSERLRQAKAAGLITPLKGKSPSKKEQILRGLAMEGLALPEAESPSDQKIVEKVRADLGLPPEPRTASLKQKYADAADIGLLQPLEGKSSKEKLRILQGLQDRGIPLPAGRTRSEDALISRVKARAITPSGARSKAKAATLSITTEKLKKAKAAGLLTPLEGKTPEQKEKILKGLADFGLPLPRGKTVSDETMIKKIKADLGLPERTPSQKMRKAKKTGLLTPLEDKTHSQKEKILRGRVAAGLPLPVGRTPSDRDLIQKIRADTGYVSPTLSERMNKAKDAGLLTPLEGKTPSAKEKILRDRVAVGVPLPEGRTPSEKEIVRKIISGEPPAKKKPSKKLREAKSASYKEKVKAERPSKVTSDKLRKAKEAGLLTPLSGKSPKEKERILKGLIEQGLPLPESKTESQKEIAKKVRKEVGLPPEPTTLSKIVKMHRAEAAGIVTPLEGKSPSQKERIVRGMVAAGIPLPEGRSASERAMIKKVQAEEKLSEKAVAGLLTPLEGKTSIQKEKIIRGRAEARIPLPEGKSQSEKALIQKIRAELGMPPPAKTISEKQVVRKAKEDGLLTPIAGKPAKEKERILKGLAKAGLPLPEGKTASEKELVRQIRAEARLPEEPTPSEKRGEIRTKSKKSGVTPSKRRVKTMVSGISEKYEDIVKTTTCDRGCGCDKKKIKFKHSYVKIRVTSPDISSLCDCPDECLPGVKAGAFIDNEGIKVTVGRVHSGATSFTSQISNHSLETHKNVITLYDRIVKDSYSSNTSIDTVDARSDIKFEASVLKKSLFDACPFLERPIDVDKLNTDLDTSCTYTSSSDVSYGNEKKNEIESNKSHYFFESSTLGNSHNEFGEFEESSRNIKFSGNICKHSSYSLHEFSVSYDSILVVRSESSLSLKTSSSDSIDATSVKSLSHSSYYAVSSTQYFPVSNVKFSNSTSEVTKLFPKSTDCSENDASADDTMIW